MGKQKKIFGFSKSFDSLKRNSGVTLVALVITIIVLLILAGVTIALVVRRQRSIKSSSKCSR